jgi:hypothetical protein
MLVDVDANQTLTAQPGQGVGIFTEYATGGHWHVWWTCDTTLTDLGCNFAVNVSIASGAITNISSQAFEPNDQLSEPTPNAIQATTTTTTGIDGIRFDTAPGDIITLDARVDGQDNGSFLFFVQDGKVNGGYSHAVTDPLMLEPNIP